MTELSGKNLRHVCSRARTWIEFSVAAISGLLLSAAFPPFEVNWLIWVALVPVLLLPIPAPLFRRFALGYTLGIAHYVTNLFWLNEVGFGAGVLLALVCALFPMCWYVSLTTVFRAMSGYTFGSYSVEKPFPNITDLSAPLFSAFTIFIAAAWVGFEWIRSWMLTGFPWNFLGVSQWQELNLLTLTRYTGVYGLSFIIVVLNTVIVWILMTWLKHRGQSKTPTFHLPVLIAAICMVTPLLLSLTSTPLGKPDAYLNIGAVQGNIPQDRQQSEERLQKALNVYDKLTRNLADKYGSETLDLFVWPESAVPAALRYNRDYYTLIENLCNDLNTPILLGTIDYKQEEGSDKNTKPEHVANSAFHFNSEATLVERYDKIHLVPFGEYIPFGNWIPGLRKVIAMGPDLTPGQRYTIFTLKNNVLAGVNICYEDAFPHISRKFIQRDADMLFTLTNDGWYAESAGSRQHMIHAVFRAAENRRTLFRSGNNSDTCMILPNGEVSSPMYGPDGEDKFIRAAKMYQVPVWKDTGKTFYTRYGDIFAYICTFIAFVTLGIILGRWLILKHQRRLNQ